MKQEMLYTLQDSPTFSFPALAKFKVETNKNKVWPN